MPHDPLLAAAAANLAGWHDLHLRALGHRTLRAGGWWCTPDAAPGLYLRAIALEPGADPAALAPVLSPEGWCGISDPWAVVDPTAGGFTWDGDRTWMRRRAGPLAPGILPEGITIDPVRDAEGLVGFEIASAHGFGITIPEPGAWHDPASLADDRQSLWVAHRDGEGVGTATAFRDAGVVGVYAISTIPALRRRGIGGALTRTAVMADPSLPAVLQASEMAIPLYRAIGFEVAGTFRSWVRAPRG